jgi:cytochrome c-type biogenesis protein CcmH
MRRAALICALLALSLAAVAGASEQKPTLAELERELICPTCQTTLELSNAPIAERMRSFIRARIAAGDTKSEIKAALVEQFGERVLAAPPKKGFNLLAWVLPLAGAALALGLLAFALVRWSRARPKVAEPAATSTNGGPPLDPELERRLDEELARYDG